MGLKTRPQTISLKQAAAAVGQYRLMKLYEDIFSRDNQKIAQVLLTHSDLSERKSYINIYHTLHVLLEYNIIPIINENDTVAIEEIQFGDNDTLSAVVSHLINADLLIILTNIDGLYEGVSSKNLPIGNLIHVVEEISDKLFAQTGRESSIFSTGGMKTKIQAAKITMKSGIPLVIANGKKEGIISSIINNESPGTIFLPKEGMLSRKRWILFNLISEGEILIDKGATTAILKKGKSLLPSGIIEVRKSFEEGAAIIIIGDDGMEIAKGLINYSSEQLHKIKGRQSKEIEGILGYKYTDEVVHRDNMALMI